MCIFVKLNFVVLNKVFNQVSCYFVLVGVLLGVFLVLSFLLLSWLFFLVIVVVLVMVFSLVIIGVFYEDGFVDVWDGFGGGW